MIRLIGRRLFSTAAAFESSPSWSTRAVFADAHSAAPVSQATLDAVSELAYIDAGGTEADSVALRRDLGQMIAYVKVIQSVAQSTSVEPRVSVADRTLRRNGLLEREQRTAESTVLQRDELLRLLSWL
jgi:hypothetical protein